MSDNERNNVKIFDGIRGVAAMAGVLSAILAATMSLVGF